jgi:hypothetical protein
MRPTRTRRRHLKEIAPVLRSTWDGRPLLPQELPIIAVEEMPVDDTDPLEAALAMFDDMLSRPAPRVATPIIEADRWGMLRAGDSGPLLVEAAVDEALPGEPTLQEGAPAMQMATAGWGDSGDLIEDWFRTGEFLTVDAEEPAPRTTWLQGIFRRVKRAVAGSPAPADAAWDAT